MEFNEMFDKLSNFEHDYITLRSIIVTDGLTKEHICDLTLLATKGEVHAMQDILLFRPEVLANNDKLKNAVKLKLAGLDGISQDPELILLNACCQYAEQTSNLSNNELENILKEMKKADSDSKKVDEIKSNISKKASILNYSSIRERLDYAQNSTENDLIKISKPLFESAYAPILDGFKNAENAFLEQHSLHGNARALEVRSLYGAVDSKYEKSVIQKLKVNYTLYSNEIDKFDRGMVQSISENEENIVKSKDVLNDFSKRDYSDEFKFEKEVDSFEPPIQF